MRPLAKSTTYNAANPGLVFYAFDGSYLRDLFSLEYQVFDPSGTQVFPAVVGTRQAVDLEDDRLGLGRYAGTWAIPAGASTGAHVVRWFYRFESTDAERQATDELEVLPVVASSAEVYCTVQDLRGEGFSTETDAHLLQRAQLAARHIERVCGRLFYPKFQDLRLDGRGGRILRLDTPIIAVEDITFETSPFRPSSLSVEPDLVRVYNRHLTQGLISPDDRNNPKLELYHHSDDVTNASPYVFTRLIWPQGQQNIQVKGVFGYTDPSPDTPWGTVPAMLRHAAKLLVVRELEKMSSAAARDDAQKRWRLSSERTRDQAYTLDGQPGLRRVGGFFTGDPEIDFILASYIRPPAMSAV